MGYDPLKARDSYVKKLRVKHGGRRVKRVVPKKTVKNVASVGKLAGAVSGGGLGLDICDRIGLWDYLNLHYAFGWLAELSDFGLVIAGAGATIGFMIYMLWRLIK